MDNDYHIASTYLKLILYANPELQALVEQKMGLDIQALLANDYVSGQDTSRFFKLVSDTGVQNWLLSYGSSVNVASHGPVGFAVLSAPDLQTALEVLVDYEVVRTSAYSSSIERTGNRTSFILEDNTGDPLASIWLLETGVSVVKSLIETILAHPLGNTAQISFAHSKPTYYKELEAIYGIECRYDQPQTAISMPASWCRITSPLYDEASFRSNLAKCQESKLKLLHDDHASTVRLRLQNVFDQRISHANSEQVLPSLTHLATELAMSSRTLNRVLKQQNTSYKHCLESVRKETAIQLLKNTHLSVANIADKLAYQEPANFVRAFKKWYSITPSAWRRSQ